MTVTRAGWRTVAGVGVLLSLVLLCLVVALGSTPDFCGKYRTGYPLAWIGMHERLYSSSMPNRYFYEGCCLKGRQQVATSGFWFFRFASGFSFFVDPGIEEQELGRTLQALGFEREAIVPNAKGVHVTANKDSSLRLTVVSLPAYSYREVILERL
jgi:hypothetical protein